MTRILTIAWQELRLAKRSGTLWVLVFVALASALTVSSFVRDDGTSEGRSQVILQYGLGTVQGLLAITALLWGAGAISLERTTGTLGILATKPLRPVEFYLGKWFGITFTCTAILTALTFIHVAFLVPRDGMADSPSVWTPFRTVDPEVDDIEDELQKVMASLPPEALESADPHELERNVRRQIRRRMNVVPAGGTRTWTFRPPPAESMEGRASLSLRFERFSFSGRTPIDGRWTLMNPATRQELLSQGFSNFYGGTLSILLPATVQDSLPIPFSLQFRNESPDSSGTAGFSSRQAVRLQFRSGSIGVNVLHYLTMRFLLMGAIVAIALLFSACFETATAAFCAGSVVASILIALGSSTLSTTLPVGHHHGDAPSALMEHYVEGFTALSQTIAAAADPLLGPPMLGWLAQGVDLAPLVKLIPASGTTLMVLVPLSLLAGVAIRRRQADANTRGRTR